jgi:hypothetical protein
VRVRRGERVRFRLGFRPTRLSLRLANGPSVSLRGSRTPVWRAERGAVVSLFAQVERGDASYAACLRLVR